MNRLKHILQMIYGFTLYWILIKGLMPFSNWITEKFMYDIGYYVFSPSDETWHKLPYSANGKG